VRRDTVRLPRTGLRFVRKVIYRRSFWTTRNPVRPGRGSKGGTPTNPARYHNLKAHPDVRIEVGTETFDATATELTGEERERVFRAQAERAPQFAEWEKNTDRTIPVIALTLKQRS
jgi:hypothetical protein